MSEAKDPYRYFRVEARQLLEGLGEGLLAVERGERAEAMRGLLLKAHTLKGAARVVRLPAAAELAHRLEELLEPLRDAVAPVPRAVIDEALAMLDSLRAIVDGLDAPVPGPVAPASAAGERSALHVPVSEVDAVLRAAVEAHAATSVLGREVAVLADAVTRLRRDLREGTAPRARADALADAAARLVARADRATAAAAEARAAAGALRLVPVRVVGLDVERAARDAARLRGCEVAVVLRGDDVSLDAHVLFGLRTALVHLVRNAVAHGLEAPDARVAVGKPRAGTVELSAERRGRRVLLRISDDGRGVDAGAIRAVLAARGAGTAALGGDALLERLFGGGITTSATADQLSGRGVGLEAVGQAVRAAGGTVAMRTAPGQGTTVEISVPVSLAAVPALSLRAAGRQLLVPLGAVRRALRLSPGDVTRDADGARIVVEGRPLPFVSLPELLGGSPGHRVRSAVVVEAGGGQAAVGVEAIGATREVVVEALPDDLAAGTVVSATALDDEGVPELVLGPDALVQAATGWLPANDVPAPGRRRMLVVDDSLTTRMLVRSILEAAGYDVDVASSGEEGLERAVGGGYAALMVDVEMPRMSGFELVEALRADARTARTPVVLVTSRGEPEARRRGLAVGADAYVVKGEFNQSELLDTLKRLVG